MLEQSLIHVRDLDVFPSDPGVGRLVETTHDQEMSPQVLELPQHWLDLWPPLRIEHTRHSVSSDDEGAGRPLPCLVEKERLVPGELHHTVLMVPTFGSKHACLVEHLLDTQLSLVRRDRAHQIASPNLPGE